MKEFKSLYEIRIKYNKLKIFYFLKYIYGVNLRIIKIILNFLKLRKNILLNDINNNQLKLIINILNFFLNNDIKLKILKNIEYFEKIKNFKGMRHLLNLPVKGQRTHTNRKTKKNYLKNLNNKLTNKYFIKI